MSDLDIYVVEAMIRDALVGYAERRDLDHLERDLRNEIRDERDARQDADGAITRTLNSRTEHLA